MLVLARHDARLSDLDSMIQDVWAGCGSHPGDFISDIDTYRSTDDRRDGAITDILRLNSSFVCKYDSDSLTELGIKVLGTTPVIPPRNLLCIIAWNAALGTGVGNTAENLDAPVRWYPPGWDGEEISSGAIKTQVCGEEESSTPDDLSPESVNAPDVINTRTGTILNGCTAFCGRLENGMIGERCRKMITELDGHPKDPLSRGDGVLWSAGIVYLAGQEEGLIVRTKGGSPLARDICEYYDLKLPSVRSKVTALKKYLA